MREFYHFMRPFVFIVASLCSFTSCGSSSSSGVDRAILEPSLATGESCKEKILTQNTDYDGDAIRDADEIYGWLTQVGHEVIRVYTNPLISDTDGDGRPDSEELLTQRFLGGQASPLRVAMHPARRDHLLALDASAGRVDGLTTSIHNTGWNIFEAFKAQHEDEWIIQNLGSSLWKNALGSSGPEGKGRSINCPQNKIECLNSPELRLIGRFVKSPQEWILGHDAFDLYDLMNPSLQIANYLNLEAESGLYLALRANGSDSTLSSRSGFLHVMVRQISSSDYPQRAPTASEENRLFETLCR